MPKNMYGGVDLYAVRFIARKARSLTHLPFFTTDDYDDLSQELMMAYLHAVPSFDPTKGDRRSFIKSVVNNRAVVLVREAARQKRWMGQGTVSLSQTLSEEEGTLRLEDTIANEDGLWSNVSCEFEERALHHDLDRVLATLSPDLVKFCLYTILIKV